MAIGISKRPMVVGSNCPSAISGGRMLLVRGASDRCLVWFGGPFLGFSYECTRVVGGNRGSCIKAGHGETTSS